MLPKTLKPMTWQIRDMTRTSLKNWLRRCTINPNYITIHYIYLWPQLDKRSVTFCSNSYDGVGGPCRSLMLRINNFPRNGTHTQTETHTEVPPKDVGVKCPWSYVQYPVRCEVYPWRTRFAAALCLSRHPRNSISFVVFLIRKLWPILHSNSTHSNNPRAQETQLPTKNKTMVKLSISWVNLVFNANAKFNLTFV